MINNIRILARQALEAEQNVRSAAPVGRMIKSAAQISTVVDCVASAAAARAVLLSVSSPDDFSYWQNGRNADTANECELRAVRADAVPGNPRSEYAFPPEASGLMTTAGIAILGHDGKEALETCFTHLQKAVGTSGAPIPQQSIPQARNPDQLRGIQFFQTVSSTLRSKINQKEGLGIWEVITVRETVKRARQNVFKNS